MNNNQDLKEKSLIYCWECLHSTPLCEFVSKHYQSYPCCSDASEPKHMSFHVDMFRTYKTIVHIEIIK